MARCRRPYSRIILMRKKNLFGTYFQGVGGGRCIKSVGGAYDVNGQIGSGIRPLRGWTGLENCTVVYLLDTFNDVDGTVIESHLLDTGQSWQLFGTSGVPDVNPATIQGNQLRFDISDQVIVADPGTGNIRINVDWTPQLDSRQMLTLRLQTDGEFLSLRMRVNPQYDIELINRTGGSQGTVHASSPYSWVPGQTYAIEVTIVSNLVTVWVDGVQIFSLIITDFNAHTLTGLGAYTNDGLGLFDNYKVSSP